MSQLEIPPPKSLSARREKWGNWKHGMMSEMRARMEKLEIGEFTQGPLTPYERQAARMARQIGIRVVTRRLRDGQTVRIYRIE